MKKLLITYHMTNKQGWDAETCIALPIEAYIADDLLQHGANSDFLDPAMDSDVYKLLCYLAAIQGYEFTEAVRFEEVGCDD